MLLLASCGKQHQAENLVEDFVEAYAQREIDIRSFSDLDSTRVIADSVILALRRNADRDPLFGKALLAPFEQHSEQGSYHTFLFIRMRYQEPGDTVEASRTFYLDNGLKGIVAFK